MNILPAGSGFQGTGGSPLRAFGYGQTCRDDTEALFSAAPGVAMGRRLWSPKQRAYGEGRQRARRG